MRPMPTPIALAVAGLVAVTLTGCANTMNRPAQTAMSSPAPTTIEYGRITGIEYVSNTASASRPPNLIGAVVGGVAGAVLGNQVGGGSGRDVATVLGGAAGAAVGSQVGRDAAPMAAPGAAYRVTVQSDQGVMRTYEVTNVGDLRVGDRVRVENNVLYRS